MQQLQRQLLHPQLPETDTPRRADTNARVPPVPNTTIMSSRLYSFPALSQPRSIRLLQWPLDEDEDGIYELHELSLDELPPYEALSYAWGEDKDRRQVIQVKGHTGNHGLAITESLAVALSYIRVSRRCRYLWCDQICINQDDLDERSGQVSTMRDIYSSASWVIVWLGEGSEGANLATALFEELGLQNTGHTFEALIENNIYGVDDAFQKAIEKRLRNWITERAYRYDHNEARRGPRDQHQTDELVGPNPGHDIVWKELDLLVSALLDVSWVCRSQSLYRSD